MPLSTDGLVLSLRQTVRLRSGSLRGPSSSNPPDRDQNTSGDPEGRRLDESYRRIGVPEREQDDVERAGNESGPSESDEELPGKGWSSTAKKTVAQHLFPRGSALFGLIKPPARSVPTRPSPPSEARSARRADHRSGPSARRGVVLSICGWLARAGLRTRSIGPRSGWLPPRWHPGRRARGRIDGRASIAGIR